MFVYPGDMLSYDRRRRDLTIDLAAGTSSTEDIVAGVESVEGGRGNDQLFGDAHENWLWGGAGADLIYGRSGHDNVDGGDGDDRLFGDDGNDEVRGREGADALSGGTGDDVLVSAESRNDDPRGDVLPRADVLACDAGADSANSDRLDTITAECETVSFSSLSLRSVPSIDADSADFALNCRADSGCAGTISLSGPDGQPFGKQAFAIRGDGYDETADAVVAVPLNAVARTTLQTGTLVEVNVISNEATRGSESGGYRIVLRAGMLSPG